VLRLYFVRHGESEANRLHVFSNRDLPHGLTARGRQQIEALADRLAPVAFADFYSSPVPRARESAAILSRRLNLPHRITPALAEWDVGTLEGTSADAGWAEYDALCSAWYERHEFSARIGGGESFDDIRARFVPFIDQLVAGPPAGPVLLLGHGGLYRCMLPIITRNISFADVIARAPDYGEAIVVEARDTGLVCVEWGAQRVSTSAE